MAYKEDDNLSEQDLQCSCCFELMVEPTTLNCGHSFCRFCLAQWWHASRHCTCPECRQPWSGFPKVNIVLRSENEHIFVMFYSVYANDPKNEKATQLYNNSIEMKQAAVRPLWPRKNLYTIRLRHHFLFSFYVTRA